jgi:hypothetical protein
VFELNGGEDRREAGVVTYPERYILGTQRGTKCRMYLSGHYRRRRKPYFVDDI